MSIKYNRPDSQQLCEIILILQEMTGIKWGYIRKNCKKIFIASDQCQLKISIGYNASAQVNIYTTPLEVLGDYDAWRELICAELRGQLTGTDKLPIEAQERVRAWPISAVTTQPADLADYRPFDRWGKDAEASVEDNLRIIRELA
jgi:hypothetical protein